MTNRTAVAMLLSLLFSFPSAAAHAGTTIKIATVAPAGTTWIDELEKLNRRLGDLSKGELTLRVYSGGVLGDESDVVRKIRIGQVHGAAFTGMGLGELLPEVRVLELPFLAKTDADVDRLISELFPRFEKNFAEKGFVLLGFVPVGFVYVLSSQPVRSLPDLRKGKVWVWEGDPLARALFEAGGVSGIPLALPDVLTSLQTGLVHTVYGTPLGGLALQWHTKVRFRMELPITQAVGGFIVSRRIFDPLPPPQQKLLKDEARALCQTLTEAGRRENAEALKTMAAQGVKPLGVDEAALREFRALAPQVADRQVGKLFPKDLLEQARRIASASAAK